MNKKQVGPFHRKWQSITKQLERQRWRGRHVRCSSEALAAPTKGESIIGRRPLLRLYTFCCDLISTAVWSKHFSFFCNFFQSIIFIDQDKAVSKVNRNVWTRNTKLFQQRDILKELNECTSFCSEVQILYLRIYQIGLNEGTSRVALYLHPLHPPEPA